MTFFRRNPGASVCTFTGGTLMLLQLRRYNTKPSFRVGAALLVAFAGAAALSAQIPGPNVNMVTGTKFHGAIVVGAHQQPARVSSRHGC